MTLHFTRRQALSTVVALGASLGAHSLVRAQSFPDKSKPIKGIVAYAAGSTADTLGRAYAQAMSESLGAQVVIENRPGAEGVIGIQAAKTAPADGYTMLFTSLSSQVVNPHLFKQLTYDPLKDFIPLAGTMKSVLLVTAGTSTKFANAKEFVESAKANPGKYTMASISATTRLAGEMFAKAAGIKLRNIPYKSFSDLTSDLLSGRVDLFFGDYPAVAPYVQQGMRPLAALSKTRTAGLPDLPTLKEQGIGELEVLGWHGAYVPANTPPAVVATLREAVQKAATSKYVQSYLKNFALEPLDLAGDAFAAFQRAEYDKWGAAVREAGLAGTL